MAQAKKVKRSENIIPNYDYLFTEEESEKKTKNHFLSKLVKRNIFVIIISTLLYVIQAAPVWVTPLLTANIINIVTETIGGAGQISSEIWKEIIINAVIILVVILQNVPTTYLRYKITSKMLRSNSAAIKSSVVRKLQSFSITYHKELRKGKIQSKFLKDTDSIDELFHCLMYGVIPNIIGAAVAFIIACFRNGYVAIFYILVIPINVFLGVVFRKTIRKRNRLYRIDTEKMSTKLTTMLDMVAVTKAHGLEEVENNSLQKSIIELQGSGHKMDKTLGYFGAWSWVVNQLLSAVCLVFCAILALKGKIKIGDIVLYQSMFSTISSYITAMVNQMPQITRGFEGLASVSEIMNVKDVEINIGKKSIPGIEGNIEFENVSYMYPNCKDYVIKDFNLKVNKGECVAFVGASGSGKSTIMNLIIGLLIATKGKVKVDDKSMTELDLSEYRHHLSVVPQNSILFAGTIRENITYGLETYTEEQLQKAVEMANINEFLDDLPDGLNTQIGELGDKLSGGQKQRITIARALIRNPKILILDEATSALDNISEYHVQKAISSAISGRTTFIVAHRLSTIRDADRIVVMDEGKIAEIGTYDELMKKKGKFYELKKLSDINNKKAEEGLNII